MRWTSKVICLFVACAVTTSVRAQVAAGAAQPDDKSHEKVVADLWSIDAATTDVPPVIDGKLDDPVWQNAKPIENFTQTDPVEGAPPSQRTVVRVLVDKDNLYISVRCYDDHPELILGNELGRDVALRSDDRVTIILDPFGTLRDGFTFQLSATGAWRDGLLENNRRRRIEWDGIWWGKTSIDDEGWSAEFRIPAKTLSFNPDAKVWGINISRVIRRDNEQIRWATPTRNSSMIKLADAGKLHGIENLQQGVGLDVKPSLSLTTRDTGVTTFDPSLDLFYKISPSIQATLTLNTDFAETEVDARQVNLTRFSLFFPEKRAFFLQDAGIFEFGGIRRSPLPFFSRRIGISGGAKKDILAGIKVTGRTDKWTFGALSVQMKDDPVLGSKNLSVLRARYNISDTSGIGLIATNGDPGTTGNNTVLGADFDFLIPNFNGNNSLQGGAYFLKSFSSRTGAANDGDGNSFGVRLSYPNDVISFFVFAGQIDKGFNPALGFAPRRGEREYAGNLRYRWRPNKYGIRRIDLTAGVFLFTDLSNTINSANLTLPRLDIQDNIGDRFSIFFSPRRERLTAPFTISTGITLPVGTYDFNRYGVSFSTASSRLLSVRVSVGEGEFFNGRRSDYVVGFDLRPSKHVFFSFELTQNDINLSEGSFITRIGRLRLNFAFTPNVSWSNFVQYDNVSDTAGLNSRFRWIIRPGSDLFVVVNQGFNLAGDSFRTAGTELTTKIGWTFRY